MSVSSLSRGHREGRSREQQDCSSHMSKRLPSTLRPLSSLDFSSPCGSASRAGAPSRGRSSERTRKKKKAKKQEEDDVKKDKSVRRSKKSRKKRHHRKKKRRRRSTSSSSSTFSSQSSSPSPPRAHHGSTPCAAALITSCRTTAASCSSSTVSGQAVVAQSGKKATGWDVGPKDFFKGGTPLPSSQRLTTAQSNAKEVAQGDESERCQQHDPRTYEKAFGVAIPSGRYGFVSEDTTDFALFSQDAGTGDERKTSPGIVGGSGSSPSSRTDDGGGSVSTSSGSLGTGPLTLGVVRLLKEANETEKRKRQPGGLASSADRPGRNPAGGGGKVTPKTHPHLFWQCWSCSADNYKTRHQCYRCNRLYMQ